MPEELRIAPSREAEAALEGRAVAQPETFRRLLPEARARAFAVARIEEFDVLRDMLEAIVQLPRGADWREIRRDLAAQVSPYMDDSPDGRRAARAKAELLLRIHGNQAYGAARHEAQLDAADALPYWQYLTVGDANVRESHAALDGKVFPADDPFWGTHYPPWDYGCRCVVAAITAGAAERMRAADAGKPESQRRVLEGETLSQARGGAVRSRSRDGTETWTDVRSPIDLASSAAEERAAYQWRPGDMRLPLDRLRERYPADIWAAFADTLRGHSVALADGSQISVMDWLEGTGGGAS